jgi:catechol 1,2-dioxygenase
MAETAADESVSTGTATIPAQGQPPKTPSQQRVEAFAGEVMAAVREVMVRHDMTYSEYDAVKQWLIDVGEAGEWPLCLDVWFESTVEQMATRTRSGSKGTILGPFYLPDAAELPTPATLPMRENEKGERLVLSGHIRSTDGRPLGGAVLDMWQSDADGFYSGFGLDGPADTLRGRVIADAEGHFDVHTILPAPYEIPKAGPTGRLIAAAGWSAYRPAHLHAIVSAEGHQPLTTQLFFEGGAYLTNDIASGVKDELILHPTPGDGIVAAQYDFVLDPA